MPIFNILIFQIVSLPSYHPNITNRERFHSAIKQKRSSRECKYLFIALMCITKTIYSNRWNSGWVLPQKTHKSQICSTWRRLKPMKQIHVRWRNNRMDRIAAGLNRGMGALSQIFLSLNAENEKTPYKWYPRLQGEIRSIKNATAHVGRKRAQRTQNKIMPSGFNSFCVPYVLSRLTGFWSA